MAGAGVAPASAPVVALHGQVTSGQTSPSAPADPGTRPAEPAAPASHPTQPRPGGSGRAAAAASSTSPRMAEATFSDGVPLPPEPGDPDGPGGPDGGWTPPSESIARAMAAARAAAQGHTPAQETGHPGPGRVALEDDVPSEDDEDAEDAGMVGLEVVKRILGATVLEDVIINPEDH